MTLNVRVSGKSRYTNTFNTSADVTALRPKSTGRVFAGHFLLDAATDVGVADGTRIANTLVGQSVFAVSILATPRLAAGSLNRCNKKEDD